MLTAARDLPPTSHPWRHCEALALVLEKGETGNVYNIGGNSEKTNLEVIKILLRVLNKPESLIEYVKDRPGHDRRYAMDNSHIKDKLGWAPKRSFEEGLKETVDWYAAHSEWWKRVKSGRYLDYYKAQYGDRLVD